MKQFNFGNRIAAALLGMGLTLTAVTNAGAAPQTAKSADAFVDSIGVNIRLRYDTTDDSGNPTVYNDFPNVQKRMQEIGFRHYRDGFTPPDIKQTIKDRHIALANIGIRGTFVTGTEYDDPPKILTPAQCLQSADKMGDAVEAFEGQNEILIRTNWTSDERNAARQYQIKLFTAVNNSGKWQNTPVLGPTCVERDAYFGLGDLSRYMDFGAAHPYPLGWAPAEPASNLFDEIDAAKLVCKDKPIYATEAGYQTGLNTQGNKRVSLLASGKYAPRLFLENFNEGIKRTYWYALVNRGTNQSKENNFGLVDYYFNYKPSGAALKNLIGLLKEASYNAQTRKWVLPNPNFTPGRLDYSFSGIPTEADVHTTNVHTTLLQKTNGKFYLCVWNEVSSYVREGEPDKADINVEPIPVTLNLNTPIASAKFHNPTRGTLGDLKIVNHRITLSVPDEVLVIELTPGAWPVNSDNLRPVADSYVRDGAAYDDQNYGSLQQLFIKKDAPPFNRWTYFKFDLASISGPITNAKLRVYGATSSDTLTVKVYPLQLISGADWTENGITWNNKPTPGSTALASQTVDTTDGYTEWDVTAFVKNEKSAGRNKFSLVVKSETISAATATFDSREASTNKPELVVTY